MTREEKELLLRGLSARFPYGVKVQINSDVKKVVGVKNGFVVTKERGLFSTKEYITRIECCRPYLRPMSSMTEEEKRQYMGFIAYSGNPNGSANFVDWLNEHHFDYRTTYDESKEKWVSMIEKGLAIEVTEENNPYK